MDTSLYFNIRTVARNLLINHSVLNLSPSANVMAAFTEELKGAGFTLV